LPQLHAEDLEQKMKGDNPICNETNWPAEWISVLKQDFISRS